jgi:hypothetical protein
MSDALVDKWSAAEPGASPLERDRRRARPLGEAQQ